MIGEVEVPGLAVNADVSALDRDVIAPDSE
jgi:hypothetical protein